MTIALTMVAISLVLISRTGFGWAVYAIGGNEEEARLSGTLLTTRPASRGLKPDMGFELNAIAAVALSGTSLMGGHRVTHSPEETRMPGRV